MEITSEMMAMVNPISARVTKATGRRVSVDHRGFCLRTGLNTLEADRRCNHSRRIGAVALSTEMAPIQRAGYAIDWGVANQLRRRDSGA
jgi:hypothetical protein